MMKDTSMGEECTIVMYMIVSHNPHSFSIRVNKPHRPSPDKYKDDVFNVYIEEPFKYIITRV